MGYSLTLTAIGNWKALGHHSFFPWYYESAWVGWQSWPDLIVSPLFWVAIVIALCITLIKAIAAISNSLEVDSIPPYVDIPVAKYYDYDAMNYTSRYSKYNTIDHWKEYERSEKTTQRGLVSVTAWILEFIVTFTQNNPYRFRDPGQFLSCFLFVIAANFFSVMVLKTIIDRFSRE